MKRSEQNEKIEVSCPVCKKKRLISKKAYIKGGGNLTDKVYLALDRSCAHKQKKTEEHKNKIKQSLIGYKQSESHIKNKSNYMKSHPKAWKNNIVTKGDKLSEKHIEKIAVAKGKKNNE